MENKDDKYLLGSLCNALQILDTLSIVEEATVADLSKMLDLSKASVFRSLHTLKKFYFVEKSPDAKYRLGMKFARYGALVTKSHSFLKTCIPFMQELRLKHDKMVSLSVYTTDRKVFFLHTEISNYALQMNTFLGSEQLPHCMASGKMLLLHLPSDKLNEYIENCSFLKITPNSITNRKELLECLEETRRNGYGTDNQESAVGLTCYAAPIYDYTNRCIAALSISGSTDQMEREKETLVSSLLECANEISLTLGSM